MNQSFLLLRLEGALMSFSAPSIDGFGATADYPALAQIAGLLANALGHDHRDYERTERLQNSLRYAARNDRPGQLMTDFQTARVGEHDIGFTTRGEAEARGGGKETYNGPVLRYRKYVADGSRLVAVGVVGHPVPPYTIDELASAVRRPARPLFIGRKSCIPCRPLYAGLVKAHSPLAALRAAEGVDSTAVPACWDRSDDPEHPYYHEEVVTDRRSWLDQVHVGQRTLRHGMITAPV